MGSIPPSVWNLTKMQYLDLSFNSLTGSIPPSVGNLTKMQYLDLSVNYLTGSIPPSIGNLTKMQYLKLGFNALSGKLPRELGQLTHLQSLDMSSCGVSGEIPSSFANLVNLEALSLSDNQLSGSIPEFIGTWTQLSTLLLEGNSFTGSIPSSLSNLTALQDLRIGDLSNGSSSLAFITNLTNLNVIRLRNITFLDSIPLALGSLTKLLSLDISFNNISGKIPDALFSLASLSYLLLGNNTLNGSLPREKSSSLHYIDVSYNQLSGNLPHWVTTDKTLQMALPSGTKCLENNFPCYRGSPRYSSFAINCGGPTTIRSSDGTLYDQDSNPLGATTYYVEPHNKWAVSNAGYHPYRFNATYVEKYSSSSPPISNTLDPELFQTARVSDGSLRFYGLGLENGNYTVLLQFAELDIPNGERWLSFRRRVFNIYIQGNMAVQDFDIRKEAGGKYFSAIKRPFIVQVTENYLEIHLLSVGKGLYGPSISAISVTPNFVPTVSNDPPSPPLAPLTQFKHKIWLVLEIALPIGFICLLFVVGCYTMRTDERLLEAQDEGVTAGFATVILVFNCYWLYRMLKRRREKRRRARNFARNGGLLLQEVPSGDSIVEKTKTFTSPELEKATDRFNKSRILGQGGQGTVYKGMLVDGRIVAIKKSNIVSEGQSQQFINEVVILSQINHRNVVKLLGCCLETDVPLLVYEFVPNGTLYQHLHQPNEDIHITWKMRLQIAAESAGALAHLHSSSTVPVYHRDIKSSNILLDEKYRVKIADFGISRTISIDEQTHLTTLVQGTMGYLDPEYFQSQQFNDKSDVYSFGVVLLELITGKKPFIRTEAGDMRALVTEFFQMMEWSRLGEILDPRMGEEAKEEEVSVVANLAMRCLHMNGRQRPKMAEVAMVLESTRSFQVSNPVEELCLEAHRAADHEVCKTFKCPFCLRSFPLQLQEASSSSSFKVMPLLSNYTF